MSGVSYLKSSMPDGGLEKAIASVEKLKSTLSHLDANEIGALKRKQDEYSYARSEREKATFSMMMKMDHEALEAIRKEFFAREDSVTIDEFMYIINKHLMSKPGEEKFIMETPDQREFGINMYELFKDIDVNGDGDLEWQEFTSFTVEKANLLNKRARLASIAHYHDSTHLLDADATYRHRHDISRFVNLPTQNNFAMVEDHKNAIFVFNSRLGKLIATINTDTAPIAIESISEKDKDLVAASGADMTISTYSLNDPNPKRRYKVQTTWATPGVQMALAYAKESRVLYSGATNGNIYSWNVQQRSLLTTLSGHSDIVMNLIVLQKLDNIASASLDKTLGVWDSHTSQEILRLYGHKKGVFDLTYNPSHRLIFSCGFEHDACVWSPFVKSLVFRLKGHHASLVGVQTVPNTDEVISADTSGVFKLWDIRKFECVQTFAANLSGNDTKDSSRLTCFFHTRLPSANTAQKEDDSRIYAASKMLFSFDQARVVHEATTDYSNVFWMSWNVDSSIIITASENNVIVWDALVGSKLFTHTNINEDAEISACCLDDRRRKIVIGDVLGHIRVYNSANGQLMKEVLKTEPHIVVSIEYDDEGKRFIAGFSHGLICIYDENGMEECTKIRQFEDFNRHSELLGLRFSPKFNTVVTAGGSSNVARLWDYVSGKCDTELHLGQDPSIVIVQVYMLDPYPLVATSDTTGNIILWGSRGCRWQGLRIAGFLNQTPKSAELEPRARRGDDDEESPQRALPPDNNVDENHASGMSKSQSRLGSRSQSVDRGTSRQRGLRASFCPAGDSDFDPYLKSSTEAMCLSLHQESEAKWGKLAPASSLCWDAETLSLFAGDELGTLRCFDLSDALHDIQIENLLSEEVTPANSKTLGICRSKKRNSQSALPPVYQTTYQDDFDLQASLYLLGFPGNAMSYLGVKFSWAFPAHIDRIISATIMPGLGILTSAADRLVKLWSFEGKPLGVLLQSVPVGKRSRSWDLILDVESMEKKENEALDELIDQAKSVADDPEKPNINTLDFSGMQNGEEAADFSRSILRQRIEKSAQILGLNFPQRQPKPLEPITEEAAAMDESVQSVSMTSGGALEQMSMSTQSKSHIDALKEVKSTEPAIDYNLKNKKMSYIQQKRKANKLQQLSKTFEAITEEKLGIKVKTKIAHSKEPSLFEDEEDNESKSSLDKFLTGDLVEHADEASEKDDFSAIDTIGSSSRAYNNTENQITQPAPLPQSHPKRPAISSKIAQSIKDAHERGPRTISMNKSCRKFASFRDLDKAIKQIGLQDESPVPEEKVTLLREEREKKHQELKNNSTEFVRTSRLSSLIDPSKLSELANNFQNRQKSFNANNATTLNTTSLGTIDETSLDKNVSINGDDVANNESVINEE